MNNYNKRHSEIVNYNEHQERQNKALPQHRAGYISNISNERPTSSPPLTQTAASTSTPTRKISSLFTNPFALILPSENHESIPSTEPGACGVTNESTLKTNEDTFPEFKGKIISIWHNMKYGWSGKLRPNFSKEQPVWLLGRCYHSKISPSASAENSESVLNTLDAKLNLNNAINEKNKPFVNSVDPIQELATDAIEEEQNPELVWEEDLEGFKKDFITRIWMTYRREFPLLNDSNYTSDCGWGCMLRSGQMLLAQALVCHFLGRSWRWDPNSQINSTHEDNLHRKIIRWFGDSSSKNSPFSIHTLVNLGKDSGKKPGDWYGPSSVSHLIKQAVKLASQEITDLDNINVYVAQDCTIFIEDIYDECLVPDPNTRCTPWKDSKDSCNMLWKSLILLVPLRLGEQKFNQIYANNIKAILSTEYCIGIIGGKPKHSLYFLGFQEDKLIHMDPHYCQEMVDVNQEYFQLNSFHCKSPRKMKLNKIDPCLCIGFYCQTKYDFDNFITTVQPYLLPAKLTQNAESTHQSPNTYETNYPMFIFCHNKKLQEEQFLFKESFKQQQEKHEQYDKDSQVRYDNSDDDNMDESEEFVFVYK